MSRSALHPGDSRAHYYETHVHTRAASACASARGAQIARMYKSMGYSGIAITDHFFNGNTRVSAQMSWDKRVRAFCQGYRQAKREGLRIGLDVFFGWEWNARGAEFLTYGLDEQFLLDNPDMLQWPLERYLKTVREAGAFVSHAHPFRKAPYIPEGRPFPRHVDAAEVVNANHRDDEDFDRLALAYARENGLLMTAGSDTHHIAPRKFAAMAFRERFDSIGEFIGALKAAQPYAILTGHWDSRAGWTQMSALFGEEHFLNADV